MDGYVAPQLHTHSVIFNMTERENGQARAVQPQSLFASQQFATAIYQSELTYRLRQLGYEITTGRSGAPEIKGYTQEYLDASSPRSRQIREYLERTGHTGKEAAEIAAHSTRDRKEIHSPAQVMAAHRKLAAEFGHQAEAVVRVARELSRSQEKAINPLERVRESLTFSRDKNFEREAVVDERALIRDGLRRGMGEVTYGQIRANLDARLASGEFQTIQRTENVARPPVHHRQDHRSRTRDRPQWCAKGRTRLSRFSPISRKPMQPIRIHASPVKKSVVEDVSQLSGSYSGNSGLRLCGQDHHVLTVIRSAVETRGYQVEGFAQPPVRHANLARPGSMHKPFRIFLARAADSSASGQRHLYFVDESSLASTNQAREFLARLGPNDRVLLIGDIRQHQGVEAGRPFEQLQQAGMRTARARRDRPPERPALKSTVELLAKGHVSAALEGLQKQGRVQEIPNREERIRAIAKSYVESPQEHADCLAGQCIPP